MILQTNPEYLYTNFEKFPPENAKRLMKMILNEDKDWLDYRSRFSNLYDQSNYESPLQSMVMRAGHRLSERPFNENGFFSNVLEIGSGTGEHLKFVRHKFDSYILTDADEKTLQISEEKLVDHYSGKLKFEKQNAESLLYSDGSFDRVIATHVLEHLYKPHLVLKEWRRVLRVGGILSVLIPTDPGVAWRLGRHLGPRKKAIAQGIKYDYVMAREHVNSCSNLIALLRYYFPHSKEAWWPFSVGSIDLNLFFAFHASIKK